MPFYGKLGLLNAAFVTFKGGLSEVDSGADGPTPRRWPFAYGMRNLVPTNDIRLGAISLSVLEGSFPTAQYLIFNFSFCSRGTGNLVADP
jgi:hypothetical protein